MLKFVFEELFVLFCEGSAKKRQYILTMFGDGTNSLYLVMLREDQSKNSLFLPFPCLPCSGNGFELPLNRS